ncbi:cytochrome P450 [Paxillus ammoniavirescens]|nr:cytochrome P450 [Paxillus ammoniavirescens]
MVQPSWALCVGLLVVVYWLNTRTRGPLPPGPRGIPILGSLTLIPKATRNLLTTATSLRKQYGDLVSVTIVGYTLVIVGSAKAAEDLFEKRNSNYSGRPRAVMAGELCGLMKHMLFSQYDDWFRGLRKLVAQEIGTHINIRPFYPMLESESRRFLATVLQRPGELQAHVRKTFTAIVLRISYGYEVKDGGDYFVDLAHMANEQFVHASLPGRYFVDFVPFLRYIPSWVPGAGFKRLAKEYAVTMQRFTEEPHGFVKQEMASGINRQSFLSRHLAQSPDEVEEDLIKWAANVIYQGGSDVPISQSYAFFLAMTLYPNVQKNAQAELDAVVGSGRLPTFEDRPSLPYCEAVFMELLRWINPAAFTIRRVREEDTYQGYTIPAGAYVFANMRAMLHDERVYKDPDSFKPERFLGDNPEMDPRQACFGFGRRKCPGYFLAYSSVWLVCVQSLAVFTISKAVEDGVEITPEIKMSAGVISYPAPFKCSIEARNAEARSLIAQDL